MPKPVHVATNHHKFITPRGVRYHIHRRSPRFEWEKVTFHLWAWSNKQSGWGEKGVFFSYNEAYALMVSIEHEEVAHEPGSFTGDL